MVQEHDANLCFTADDRIFLGEGLFETLRVVKNKPCFPEAHWQRLKKSASFLGLTFDISFEVWFEKLNECIKLHAIQEGGIKAILSSGRAPRGLSARSKETTLILTAFPYTRSPQPLSLMSAPWQRDAKNPTFQLKSINYLEAIIALRYAQSAGFDDVLFFNFQNHATETTVANFFIIKNNQLITPPLHSGVLPGIIRERLLFLSKKQGIPCLELELRKDNLIEAEAAFTCNALQGIRPVRTFDNHAYTVKHPILETLSRFLMLEEYD
ncbi:4-amino-4-deoxychorismate lyase [Legionella micdadei]|nr:aminodeoxychorismate lyase [Legionella micdadei]SCY23798.1 4-amino-4-deoxychorismate lyase [Legionella micdadei]